MTLKRTELPHDQKPDQFLNRLEELRAVLRIRTPEDLAARTGAVFEPRTPGYGNFYLPIWNQEMVVNFPELIVRTASTGQETGAALQALVLYYFLTSDDTPPTDRYIAFSELPYGKFYTQAYQGYTGNELARRFENDPEALEKAALMLGGVPQSFGDHSYAFTLFPRVSLLVVYWQGDEDFPTNCQVLFDAAAPHHLPTDACAIAGSMLTRKLLASG